MEKTIFTIKKIIISCVNYQTLHVKQQDVASSVRPETKPLSLQEDFKTDSLRRRNRMDGIIEQVYFISNECVENKYGLFQQERSSYHSDLLG